MQTTEAECIEALREAAKKLGETPTKAQYEELGLTPASATIIRVMGGWNDAKEAAGLETIDRSDTGGTEIQPKPNDVDIPDDVSWHELTGQQRWYYKNRRERIDRKDRRRSRLRRWLYEHKRQNCECVRCGEGRPGCLDFHHPGEKTAHVSEMIVDGYSKDSLLSEIDRCTVLCANCHRLEHYEPPKMPDRASDPDKDL